MGEFVTLEEWAAGRDVDFHDEAAEQDYQARAERLRKAIELERPDRVPVGITGGLLAADYAGVDFETAMYDPDAQGKAVREFTERFQPDTLPRSFTPIAKMLEELDFTLINWPGGQLDSDSPYQFVEDEYMKPEEYDEFLRDPTGYFLRTYVPRIADGLEGFESMPILANPMFDSVIPALGAPPVLEAFETLLSAAEIGFEHQMVQVQYESDLEASGYPDVVGGISEAPFDALSDTIRGTKGIMIDLRKRPEKVRAALDMLTDFMIDIGVGTALESGTPFVFIPLHKGSDAFLSKADYREFYWPSLRAVIDALSEQGLIPCLFAEGSYDERLEILDGDLPDGEVIWWFDKTDMTAANSVLGDQACLMGNVPAGLLKTGSPTEVEAYCVDLIERAGPEGLIVRPGCTPNRAPAENLEAMIEAPKTV